MAKKTFGITGTSGRTYDLPTIEADSRLNGEKPLIVQVYKYKSGENPNPSNLVIGQLWTSQLIVDDVSSK